MNTKMTSFLRRILLDQSGQVLPSWIVAAMVPILGMAGLTADVGHAYVVRNQLQNGTNAAALAAAGNVYTTGSAMQDAANQFASISTGYNAVPYTTGNPTVTPLCLNSLLAGDTGCKAYSANANPACLYETCNAVRVSQTASVPTYFMELLGIPKVSITTTAMASMGGNVTTPPNVAPGPYNRTWNIAIIEDATGSMATADSNCPGSVSEFACALNSIQTILSELPPCPVGMSSCTPSQAHVRVALFSFPNMVTSYLPNFYKSGCSSDLSSIPEPLPYAVYTLPPANASSYDPVHASTSSKFLYTQGTGGSQTTLQASYEFTLGADSIDSSGVDAQGFVSDYYSPSNTTTGNLNSSSPLVRLVGYGGTSGQAGTGSGGTSYQAPCMPISEAGIALNGATGTVQSPYTVNTGNVGEGITYYAAAIYAAQAALTAEATAYPGSSNAIIFLSDGQANLQWIYFPPGGLVQTPTANKAMPYKQKAGSTAIDTLNTAINYSAQIASKLGSPNGEGTAPISGLYPDFFDECQQAIAAAQYAAELPVKSGKTNTANQPTRVYAIAYGSEQTGCGSGNVDNHNDVTTVATGYNQSFTAPTLTPCITMENIASDLKYFYSDYWQSGSSVDSTCIDNSHPVSSLNGIAQAITASFTSTRLLPSNAT